MSIHLSPGGRSRGSVQILFRAARRPAVSYFTTVEVERQAENVS
ncbi:hypothetical protein BACCAP_02760 [Pseudoflavonifractor capillosus ATCC 29799]|uniref:Uncharacterized protein n=1 Tax=Pseudoflavonifractor capillosus ATCC 29799 TaxID=411467 RepID=A6NX16_9FIRM|nr:hypothetical protein BACCAP_02760 [Pseudoflavonifractor capillosus ATCC 29799]